MAYPANWAMLSEQLTWSQQNGWTVSQQWRGPAGPGKATRSAWLAEWTAINGAYVTLNFTDALPTLDGEAVCEANIGYSSTPEGEPIPPGGDDYGLIQRQWTLGAVDVQRSIRENPNVELLAQRWNQWPSELRRWVATWKQQQDVYLEKWKADGYPEPGPTRPEFKVPEPAASVGATPEELDLSYTLVDRLLTDDTPSWVTTDYTLRKTETVTSWSTMVVAHEYVNRYLSWDALVELEPTLPATGLIQTGGLESLIWLKKAPEVTVSSGGNYELSQDYVGTVRPDTNSKRERDLVFDYGPIVETIP
jgi:hypothetical protein